MIVLPGRFEQFVCEVRQHLLVYKFTNSDHPAEMRHLRVWLHWILADNYGKSKNGKYNKWTFEIHNISYGKISMCRLMFGALLD